MLRQEMSMCCFSTTKIFNYCLVQQTIAITHCRGAVQQQYTKYLSLMFGHQQLLTGTETLEHSFNQELWVNVKGRYLKQQWIYAYRHHQYSTYSSMSIDHNIFNVHCPYQPLSISTISNIKVDHSMLSNKHNSAATNVSNVEQEEYCNKAS